MPKSKKTKVKAYRKVIFVFYILLIFFFLLSLPGVSVYEPPPIHGISLNFQQIPSPALYPYNNKKLSALNVTAEGVIIIDLQSGVTLYEKNAKNRFPPASTTKIVTALVALDDYKLDDILEVKPPLITQERLMGLVPGEKLTVENLLYGALVHSANDAPYVLAQNFQGGVDVFVEKMNAKVAELGLKDTHFTNPIGFEDPDHYTTASDLAKLSRVALANNIIKKIIGTKEIVVSDVNFTRFHKLDNVNELLGKIPGVYGVKTGWTEVAREVLSTTIIRDGHEVLIVLLRSEDRFGETEQLINWIFNNFKWLDLRPTETETPNQ